MTGTTPTPGNRSHHHGTIYQKDERKYLYIYGGTGSGGAWLSDFWVYEISYAA